MPNWRSRTGSFIANHSKQSPIAKQNLQTRLYEIIGELGSHDFDSALFSEIEDFQKTIWVP